MTATAPTSMDPKTIVRAFKRAERANREAARSFAQFIEHLECLGFKFEIVDIEKERSQPSGQRPEDDDSNLH